MVDDGVASFARVLWVTSLSSTLPTSKSEQLLHGEFYMRQVATLQCRLVL
jgi:hypothetical protein